MSAPYVGEIRMFAGNFAPAGWAFCEGQLIPISENDTLFNLIGTTYGGDGQETFGLPDLRGRIPVHMGQGPGISQQYVIGETGGVEQVTLTTSQMPAHSHAAVASNNQASPAYAPSGSTPGVLGNTGTANLYGLAGGSQLMHAASIEAVGGSQPHDNFAPYLCVSFIISLYGIYPSQT